MHKKSAATRENTRRSYERNLAGALVLGAVALFVMVESQPTSHAVFAALTMLGIAFGLALHMRISASRKRRRFAAWLIGRPTVSGNVHPIVEAVRARAHDDAEAGDSKKSSQRSAGR